MPGACHAEVRCGTGSSSRPRRGRRLLALPIDLVPDVIPVAGQLDDAILVAFVIRRVLRAAGPGIIREALAGA